MIKIGSSKPLRVSPLFVKDMKMISIERIKRGLANPLNSKEISFREMTDLITRTSAYKNVLEELKTKPKKDDKTII